MKEAGVKKALCVNQEVGNVALDLRCKGFTEGLGGKVRCSPSEWTRPRSATPSRRHSPPTPISTASWRSAPLGRRADLAALEELGMIGKVKFATFDLSPSVLKAIADGKMMFAIDQQQYLQGYLPVVLARAVQKYGLMPGGNVMTGPGFVTKDKAAQVIELAAKGIR